MNKKFNSFILGLFYISSRTIANEITEDHKKYFCLIDSARYFLETRDSSTLEGDKFKFEFESFKCNRSGYYICIEAFSGYTCDDFKDVNLFGQSKAFLLFSGAYYDVLKLKGVTTTLPENDTDNENLYGFLPDKNSAVGLIMPKKVGMSHKEINVLFGLVTSNRLSLNSDKKSYDFVNIDVIVGFNVGKFELKNDMYLYFLGKPQDVIANKLDEYDLLLVEHIYKEMLSGLRIVSFIKHNRLTYICSTKILLELFGTTKLNGYNKNKDVMKNTTYPPEIKSIVLDRYVRPVIDVDVKVLLKVFKKFNIGINAFVKLSMRELQQNKYKLDGTNTVLTEDKTVPATPFYKFDKSETTCVPLSNNNVCAVGRYLFEDNLLYGVGITFAFNN